MGGKSALAPQLIYWAQNAFKKLQNTVNMSLVRFKQRRPSDPFPSIWDEFFKRDTHDSRNVCVPGNSVPAVNISETDEGFSVQVAAPGFNKTDFELEVDHRTLKVKGEHSEKEEQNDKHYSRREFNFTSFNRTFTLPETVEADKISAEYDAGVLHILIPKKAEAVTQPARVIKVK